MPTFAKPTPAPAVSKGPSVEDLQREIIQTRDPETRTRLIQELRARFRTQEE